MLRVQEHQMIQVQFFFNFFTPFLSFDFVLFVILLSSSFSNVASCLGSEANQHNQQQSNHNFFPKFIQHQIVNYNFFLLPCHWWPSVTISSSVTFGNSANISSLSTRVPSEWRTTTWPLPYSRPIFVHAENFNTTNVSDTPFLSTQRTWLLVSAVFILLWTGGQTFEKTLINCKCHWSLAGSDTQSEWSCWIVFACFQHPDLLFYQRHPLCLHIPHQHSIKDSSVELAVIWTFELLAPFMLHQPVMVSL